MVEGVVIFMKGIEYRFIDDDVEIKTCRDNIHASKAHMHKELSIGYITKGSTVLDINNTRYLFKEGDAMLIYPFTSHKCQPVNRDCWEYTMIYVNKKLFNAKEDIGIKRLRGENFEKLKRLSKFLISRASKEEKENEILNILEKFVEEKDIEISLKSSEIMNEIKSYIDYNFLETLTLEKIENAFHLDRFSLIKEFKKEFNTTPSAYQLQLKVNYSKSLLCKDSNLADIAIKSGFYDQAHFTREFKKAYGVTPLKYYKDIH